MTKKRYFKLVMAMDAIIRKEQRRENPNFKPSTNQRKWELGLMRHINENPLFELNGEKLTRKELMTLCVSRIKDLYPINFKGV